MEETPGTVEWPGWRQRIERIAGEGLKIGFRNHIGRSQPEYVRKEAAYRVEYAPEQPPKPLRSPDPADPLYRRAVVHYYRATGELAAAYPKTVYSTNANYGIRGGLGTKRLRIGATTMKNFRQLVRTDLTGVFATPYQTREGNILTNLLNITALRVGSAESDPVFPRLC